MDHRGLHPLGMVRPTDPELLPIRTITRPPGDRSFRQRILLQFSSNDLLSPQRERVRTSGCEPPAGTSREASPRVWITGAGSPWAWFAQPIRSSSRSTRSLASRAIGGSANALSNGFHRMTYFHHSANGSGPPGTDHQPGPPERHPPGYGPPGLAVPGHGSPNWSGVPPDPHDHSPPGRSGAQPAALTTPIFSKYHFATNKRSYSGRASRSWTIGEPSKCLKLKSLFWIDPCRPEPSGPRLASWLNGRKGLRHCALRRQPRFHSNTTYLNSTMRCPPG